MIDNYDLIELTVPDDELVAAAQGGDRLAFGALYVRHHGAAWRVACVVTGFSADAEVALINGFTVVCDVLAGQPPDTPFRRSLLTCVRSSALEHLRRRCRDEIVVADDFEVNLRAIEHENTRREVRRLPEQSRTALWLTDVEAMTPSEVAVVLGIDPAAGSALATRARAVLDLSPEDLAAAAPTAPLMGGECQRHWAMRPRASLRQAL